LKSRKKVPSFFFGGASTYECLLNTCVLFRESGIAELASETERSMLGGYKWPTGKGKFNNTFGGETLRCVKCKAKVNRSDLVVGRLELRLLMLINS